MYCFIIAPYITTFRSCPVGGVSGMVGWLHWKHQELWTSRVIAIHRSLPFHVRACLRVEKPLCITSPFWIFSHWVTRIFNLSFIWISASLTTTGSQTLHTEPRPKFRNMWSCRRMHCWQQPLFRESILPDIWAWKRIVFVVPNSLEKVETDWCIPLRWTRRMENYWKSETTRSSSYKPLWSFIEH